MNAMDIIYEDAVRKLAGMIGWDAVYEAAKRETYDRLDSTRRQALDIDGAFAREMAEIVRDFPGWDLKFEKDGDGFKAKIRGYPERDPNAEAEGPEILRRLNDAFAKYVKVTDPGIKLEITESRGSVPVDDTP